MNVWAFRRMVVADSERSAGCAPSRYVHIDFAHCSNETSVQCRYLVRIGEHAWAANRDALQDRDHVMYWRQNTDA
jgi:hypothetical protein